MSAALLWAAQDWSCRTPNEASFVSAINSGHRSTSTNTSKEGSGTRGNWVTHKPWCPVQYSPLRRHPCQSQIGRACQSSRGWPRRSSQSWQESCDEESTTICKQATHMVCVVWSTVCFFNYPEGVWYWISSLQYYFLSFPNLIRWVTTVEM